MADEPTKNGTEVPGGDGKPTFSAEQQSFIDGLIQKSMGKAAAQVRQENETLKTQLSTLNSELDEAKKKLSEAGTKSEKKEAGEELVAIQKQIAEIKQQNQQEKERLESQIREARKSEEKAKTEALNVRKQVAIQDAAGDTNFFSVEAVRRLTEDRIQWSADRNSFVVMREDGSGEQMNSSYEPMSLKEFYKSFAASNSYLVRGEVKGGAGSSEGTKGQIQTGKYTPEQIFGPKSSSALANKLALEDKKEYTRLKAAAKAQGLIP